MDAKVRFFIREEADASVNFYFYPLFSFCYFYISLL